jgi:hypothetical protein
MARLEPHDAHHKDESMLCKRCVWDGIAVGVLFTLGGEVLFLGLAVGLVWILA